MKKIHELIDLPNEVKTLSQLIDFWKLNNLPDDAEIWGNHDEIAVSYMRDETQKDIDLQTEIRGIGEWAELVLKKYEDGTMPKPKNAIDEPMTQDEEHDKNESAEEIAGQAYNEAYFVG